MTYGIGVLVCFNDIFVAWVEGALRGVLGAFRLVLVFVVAVVVGGCGFIAQFAFCLWCFFRGLQLACDCSDSWAGFCR